MLSAPNRLRHSADFSQVVRYGRRAGRGAVTVHALQAADPDGRARAPRAGLVVGRNVGGSVVRSQTSRRLRHLLRARVAGLPGGLRLVVRAAAGAGAATSAQLGADLDRALAAALAPAGARPERPRPTSARPERARPERARPERTA